MFEYDYENEDKNLKLVGLELMFLTPEKHSNPQGITAVELSKRIDVPLDIVKKSVLYSFISFMVVGSLPQAWSIYISASTPSLL